ncbi:MAG: cysteine-rich VLP domain-containing protein [Oscillospiraceae bacterium]|nr:cysteine-rich VLP domain-containing protein [Oscillospiraceae bacterium]
MSGTRELTREERAAIKKLVTKSCANYCGHYKLCLPLDTGCYMLGKWWTGSYCKYFQSAVLPLDPALEAALLGNDPPEARLCAACGEPIRTTGNRAKYCAACAGAARRRRQREYMREKRG